jgi:hypothetical protein
MGKSLGRHVIGLYVSGLRICHWSGGKQANDLNAVD